MEKLKTFAKGYRTFMTGVLGIIVGALTGSGFLTPELGVDVTMDVLAVIDHLENLAAAIGIVGGTLGIAWRAVTDTPIFKKM